MPRCDDLNPKIVGCGEEIPDVMRHKRVCEAVDCSFQDKFVVGVAKLWPPLEIDLRRIIRVDGC